MTITSRAEQLRLRRPAPNHLRIITIRGPIITFVRGLLLFHWIFNGRIAGQLSSTRSLHLILGRIALCPVVTGMARRAQQLRVMAFNQARVTSPRWDNLLTSRWGSIYGGVTVYELNVAPLSIIISSDSFISPLPPPPPPPLQRQPVRLIGP